VHNPNVAFHRIKIPSRIIIVVRVRPEKLIKGPYLLQRKARQGKKNKEKKQNKPKENKSKQNKPNKTKTKQNKTKQRMIM